MSELLRTAAGVDPRAALVLYLLLLDTWALAMLLTSGGSRREKGWWSVIILLCPIIGLLLWYNLGPRPRHRRKGGRQSEAPR